MADPGSISAAIKFGAKLFSAGWGGTPRQAVVIGRVVNKIRGQRRPPQVDDYEMPEPIGFGTWTEYPVFAGTVTPIGKAKKRKRLTEEDPFPEGVWQLPRGLPRTKDGKIDVKKLPTWARKIGRLVNRSPGAYFAIQIAEYLYDAIFGDTPEIRERARSAAEEMAERQAIAIYKLGEAAREANEQALQKIFDAEYAAPGIMREAERKYEARQAEARQKKADKIAQNAAKASKQRMNDRIKLALSGVAVAASVLGGRASRAKAGSQNVAVNVPNPSDYLTAGFSPLTGFEAQAVESPQARSAEEVCSCRPRYTKRRRKKRGEKRICYTRKTAS